MLPPKAVWFITGCSSGIGAAIASYITTQNHRLVATARNTSSLSYLDADNSNILKLALDVNSTASVDAALDAAIQHFGRIDVVVNNAGINTFGVAEAVPESRMREIMETNFWGPMHLTRRAVAVMRETNPKTAPGIGGTIVNVSSIGGRAAFPAEAAYHASKFALEGFTEAIASELDPEWRIRLLILEPGGTKSKFTTSSGAGTDKGVRHPAYSDPKMPVNVMLDALTSPQINEGLVDAERVASCLFEVLQGEELPLRLPTGRDSYAAIQGKEKAKMEELEAWRGVSEVVGGGEIPT